MEKANLKNTTIFNAFKIFLYFTNNIPFTITHAFNFLEFGYIDGFGSEAYNNELKRKEFRKIMNTLEEAFEELKLPYNISKEYLSLTKRSECNLYKIFKTSNKSNFISFDIETDDLKAIQNNIPFYIYNKLLNGHYLTVKMLINILNCSTSAVYRLIEKINTSLYQCKTNTVITTKYGLIKLVAEEECYA